MSVRGDSVVARCGADGGIRRGDAVGSCGINGVSNREALRWCHFDPICGLRDSAGACLDFHDVGSGCAVDVRLRQCHLPVVEIEDDVHASQNRVAEGVETHSGALGRYDHEDAFVPTPWELVWLIRGAVVGWHNEFFCGDGDVDFTGEGEGDAVAAVGVAAGAQAMSVDVREVLNDEWVVALWDTPGGASGVEEDWEGVVAAPVGINTWRAIAPDGPGLALDVRLHIRNGGDELVDALCDDVGQDVNCLERARVFGCIDAAEEDGARSGPNIIQIDRVQPAADLSRIRQHLRNVWVVVTRCLIR